jgi:hypothetical protein
MKTVTNESVKQEIDQLTNEQLVEVADFIDFLKFRKRRNSASLDVNELAKLATEFASEDRELAEVGMGDYVNLLNQADNL